MSRLAIITGAGSGLGKAICEVLSEVQGERPGGVAGEQIVCIAIARGPIADGPLDQITADLSRPHNWPAIVGPMLSDLEFSRITFFDIAAVLPHGAAQDADFKAKMDEAMRVNVTSPLAIARALAQIARSRTVPLDVVHISSGAALRPIANWGAYCASKAAAAMAWRVFEAENDFVTAHIIQPGVIATKMQQRLREEGDPNAAPRAALRSPHEVARDILRQCGFAP
ncbi:SDR family NAD(P)-dependent oxidoreductase [uncultured Erythrobacter sp.]|uniref:SDR family NAD(P)-dependent oxidoreductase n=1 Tax=uncultured Erythrobacter sp. TaxID=263913 RepID=UPI00261C4222|nr:SDR family NAD(P)-dependent oxidoreductase [uncultured Erythrobacter sp.]